MASYMQTVSNTLSSAWLGKRLDWEELAPIKSCKCNTPAASTRWTLTANVIEPIKEELDKISSQSKFFPSVQCVYVHDYKRLKKK
jgi:hypothetical protein